MKRDEIAAADAARQDGSIYGGGFMSGDEEEYSFKGFSDSGRAAHEHENIGYGDFIIEEFSPETNTKRISGWTHISETAVAYLLSALYATVGALCVGLNNYIVTAFPYFVGGFMAAIGLFQFVYAVRTKEYVHTHSNKTATSLILIALSVLIMIETEWAVTFISIAWGIFGLLEGAHAFNHALSRMARAERSLYYFVKGAIEVALAFVLLYEPDGSHIQLHIIVFGVQLVFDAVTMFPPFKNFFSKK